MTANELKAKVLELKQQRDRAIFERDKFIAENIALRGELDALCNHIEQQTAKVKEIIAMNMLPTIDHGGK